MLKKFLALVLAGAMVIGSALPAMAAKVGTGTLDSNYVVTGHIDYVEDTTPEVSRTNWLVVDDVVKSNGSIILTIGGKYETYEYDATSRTYTIDPNSLKTGNDALIPVKVTLNAGNGYFLDRSTGAVTENSTWTSDVILVDSDAKYINLGMVENVPNVVGEDANHKFKYWADTASAGAQNLSALVSTTKANGEDFYTATFYANWEDDTATNNKKLDDSISVAGLDDGDVAKFYKVLEWDTNADSSSKTGGWKAAAGFESLTEAEIQRILGLDADGKTPSDRATNPDAYGISAELAAKIGNLAKAAQKKYEATAANGVATITDDPATTAVVEPESGLYVALIAPIKPDVVYNPVFVGADYVNNTSNNFAVVNMADSYSPKAMAKKEEIQVDKTAKVDEVATNNPEDGMAETVKVGETVHFSVKTTIPEFSDDYYNVASYKVTDQLSQGLELVPNTVKVYKADVNGNKITPELGQIASDLTTTRTAPVTGALAIGSSVTKAYTTTENADKKGYTVEFEKDYLLYVINAPTDIIIEYDAKVTTDAPKSVNVENNTVTVEFSNNPLDSNSKGKLKDETKHYTFDLDAEILGPTEGDSYHYTPGGNPWYTTEVVKVGIDRYGNEITQTRTLHGSHDGDTTITRSQDEQKIGALQGAIFMLYTDPDCNTVYYNDIMKQNPGYRIVSDATGRLNIEIGSDATSWTPETLKGIRGLDAGTYWLKEIKAPDGYIKAQYPIEIKIEAEFEDVKYTETWGTASTDDDVEWTVKELKSYTVTVGGQQTGTYTIKNSQSQIDKSPQATSNTGDRTTGNYGLIKSDGSTGVSASAGKVQNVQGVELPSTGGIGTTIFYMGGAILVLLAGVLLVSKRRIA